MKAQKKPTVISLFAGCGGSSLGYRLVGCDERLAVEYDDNAVKTLRLNFPDLQIYHGDVADLSVERCLEISRLAKGELDVLDGSPPCQGFSVAGHRKINDVRNTLFREYVRLLGGLKPKAFIMENVRGLVLGAMKRTFLTIISELRACGYRVKAQLMNAQYYNVPQSRERVIFVGIREDLGIEPSHPKPQTRPISLCVALKGADTSGTPKLGDKYGRTWKLLKPGQNCGKIMGVAFQTCKVNPLRPSPTLMKSQTGRGFATLMHWSECRALSIGEGKRIASFPDDFRFLGGYQEQWSRIGNCVPPNMMRAIAEHVCRLIAA